MNTGKTLFAQIMDFLPWSTFDRILPGEFGSSNLKARPAILAGLHVLNITRLPS
jgi:hypothetical protein